MRRGAPEDYFCFMDEIRLAIRIFQFPAFENVVVSTINSSSRDLKISFREKPNVLLECEN